MNCAYYVTRLAASADAIESLVKHVDIGMAGWKPAPDKWSILEVICHLYDEERFDFRAHLEELFAGREWTPFDTIAWVTEHRYAEQDIVEMRTLFKRERERSIAWLSGLESPDWNLAFQHPRLGEITGGTLLRSWVAHDYLHIRQLARLHHQRVAAAPGPHGVWYAGDW
jgi:hypothetical protein